MITKLFLDVWEFITWNVNLAPVETTGWPVIRLNVILEESSYARLDSKLLRVCDQYLREAFCFSEKGNGKKLSWQYIYVYIFVK